MGSSLAQICSQRSNKKRGEFTLEARVLAVWVRLWLFTVADGLAALLVLRGGPAAATTFIPTDGAALVQSWAVIAVGSVRRLQSLALADGSIGTEAILALE